MNLCTHSSARISRVPEEYPLIPVLRSAIMDAVAHQSPPDDCADCKVNPLGRCTDHAEDLDCMAAYLWLARRLGLEPG